MSRGGREVICSWATPIAVPGEIFMGESGSPPEGSCPSRRQAHLKSLPRSVGVGTAQVRVEQVSTEPSCNDA